jgi:hypothetical protein
MLKNQWTDAAFGFASLNDRRPVQAEDDVIVLAAPDPPGADDAIRISSGGGWGLGVAPLSGRWPALCNCSCDRPVEASSIIACTPALPACPSAGLAEGQAMVMFNPRLASGDVGVGLSIRRLRESFLNRFTTTYSLRPIADVGSVFRRYPGTWQVQWGWGRGRTCGAAGRVSVREGYS